MARLLLTAALLIATLGALSGCGVFRGGRSVDETAPVTLHVINNNSLDVVIYTTRGATRTRIGSVPGISTRQFVLSDKHTGGDGRVRLLADPVGTVNPYSSDEIVVKPGYRLEWTLESDFRRSTLAIY